MSKKENKEYRPHRLQTIQRKEGVSVSVCVSFSSSFAGCALIFQCVIYVSGFSQLAGDDSIWERSEEGDSENCGSVLVMKSWNTESVVYFGRQFIQLHSSHSRYGF